MLGVQAIAHIEKLGAKGVWRFGFRVFTWRLISSFLHKVPLRCLVIVLAVIAPNLATCQLSSGIWGSGYLAYLAECSFPPHVESSFTDYDWILPTTTHVVGRQNSTGRIRPQTCRVLPKGSYFGLLLTCVAETFKIRGRGLFKIEGKEIEKGERGPEHEIITLVLCA